MNGTEMIQLASVITAGFTVAVGSIAPALGQARAVAQALADCGCDITQEDTELTARKRRVPGFDTKDESTLATETHSLCYCLAEGGENSSAGPTGSAMLTKVFAGILVNPSISYLAHTERQPDPDIASTNLALTLADLVAYANELQQPAMAETAVDIPKQHR